MKKMTCLVMVPIGVALFVGSMSVRAGDLDSPAAPSSPDSAMYTLEDIYQKLNLQGTTVTKRSGAFTEPDDGPTNGTMHTLNDIMMLVTSRAPVSKTGQTASGATGDDGDLQIGVAWPNPRFTVNSTPAYSNCVTDNLTGLMWLSNPDENNTMTWSDAVAYCQNLDGNDGRGGYTDWRLPNVNELLSLMDWGVYQPAIPNTAGTGKWSAGDPFVSIISSLKYAWSSTPTARYPDYAWYVHIGGFGVVGYHVKTASNAVWPVRGGK